MSDFTSLYAKTRDVLTKQKFATPDWDKFLTQTCPVASLFSPTGFDAAKQTLPDKLREKLLSESKHTNVVAVFLLGGGPGETIYKAAQNKASPGTWKERAAALKVVKHVYHAHKQGGQDVWVYSPPKSHTLPMFEEVSGSDDTAKAALSQEKEIFSPAERGLMCEALGVARKIAMDAMVKIGAGEASTLKMVERWFLDESCGDVQLNDALSKLATGIRKIAAACNSPTLVFTDLLDWRAERNNIYGGAQPGGEGGGFPVIYLEGAFTRLTGNSGKLWLCAETILHELSHHELSTDDHRYDSDGLKPDRYAFPYAKTIDNADSWGYFMLDLAGYLSNSDRLNTLC